MSALKVERLFRSLDADERKAFRVELETRSRALVKLLDALETLEKRGGSLARAKRRLAQALYDAPYSPASDARFRNDCRNLAERLERFLAERQSVKTLAENPLLENHFLLEALLERGLWTEFEARYRKAKAAAETSCDHDILLALDHLRLRQLWESRAHTRKALEHLLESVAEAEAHLKERYATEHSFLASIRSVALHYLYPQSPPPSREPLGSVDFSNVQTPLAEYYAMKSRAFERPLHADIDALRNAMNLILRLPSLSPNVRQEQLAALGNLGLAYMINGDYQNALRYYRKAFEFSETHRVEFGAPLAFNYASVLMKLKRYDEAARLFQSRWELFAKGALTRHRAEAMRCFCHVFLGETEIAKSFLPRSLAPYPLPVQNYFHFAKVAILVGEDALLDAEREICNLLKRFRRNKSKAKLESEIRLASLYRKFVRACQSAPDASNATEFAKLKSELERFLNDYPEHRDSLPVVWLEQKLD